MVGCGWLCLLVWRWLRSSPRGPSPATTIRRTQENPASTHDARVRPREDASYALTPRSTAARAPGQGTLRRPPRPGQHPQCRRRASLRPSGLRHLRAVLSDRCRTDPGPLSTTGTTSHIPAVTEVDSPALVGPACRCPEGEAPAGRASRDAPRPSAASHQGHARHAAAGAASMLSVPACRLSGGGGARPARPRAAPEAAAPHAAGH